MNMLVVDDDQIVLDPTGVSSAKVYNGSGEEYYSLSEAAAHHLWLYMDRDTR